jgi:hypothetical protein
MMNKKAASLVREAVATFSLKIIHQRGYSLIIPIKGWFWHLTDQGRLPLLHRAISLSNSL